MNPVLFQKLKQNCKNLTVLHARWDISVHLLSDLMALILSYICVYVIRFPEETRALLHHLAPPDVSYSMVYFEHAPKYILSMASALILIYSVLGFYNGYRCITRSPIAWTALVCNGAVLGVLSVYLYFTKSEWHMRGFLPLVLATNIPVTFLFRHFTAYALNRSVRVLNSYIPSLLIGENKSAQVIQDRSDSLRLKGCKVVQRLASPSSPQAVRELLTQSLTADIGAVFVMDPDLNTEIIMTILKICHARNITVRVLFPHAQVLHNPFAYGDFIHGIPVVTFVSKEMSFHDSKVYQFLSRVAACILMLPFGICHLIVLVMIKFDDGGPAFFVQERIGLNGQIFKMYKYRTMCLDAEAKLEALRCQNETDGALFKMRQDPRVTRLGRILRKTSIDELPQLINILRGEMQFVGPRPLPVKDLDEYRERWQMMRHYCPPGVTCLWQVVGRSNIGFEDMCLLDIWYMCNRSVLLDIRICLRTVRTVIFGIGAY